MSIYFRKQTDPRSFYKLQQIEFAINKQKNSYQVIEHAAVTDFWERYIAYQKEHYPHLWLSTNGGSKGSRASWPRYRVHIKGLYMLHKSEFGFIDLTFPNCGERTVELKGVLEKHLGDLTKIGVSLHQTKKSAALRVVVPVLDFKQPFEAVTVEVAKCFEGIEKLTAISERLPADEIILFCQM